MEKIDFTDKLCEYQKKLAIEQLKYNIIANMYDNRMRKGKYENATDAEYTERMKFMEKRLREIAGRIREYEKQILHYRNKLEIDPIKPGRPTEFQKKDTLKWYNELSKKKEFQKQNGTPHKTKIIYEICERHKAKTGNEPSDKTIKAHLKG
jgi:hypothetical protein